MVQYCFRGNQLVQRVLSVALKSSQSESKPRFVHPQLYYQIFVSYSAMAVVLDPSLVA